MKNQFRLFLAVACFSLFAGSSVRADDISVNVNGKTYQCSGEGGGGGSGNCQCDYRRHSSDSYPDVCLYPTGNSEKAIECWYGGVSPGNAFKTCAQKMKEVCGG